MVTLLDSLMGQLERRPSVLAVSLFGSRARAAADGESDVDLQIITSDPRSFRTPAWLQEVPYSLVAYALRPAFGGVVKATLVFDGVGEADVVVLPAGRLRVARVLVRLGLHRRSAAVRRGLGDLAIVLRPGFQVLKGARDWEPFLRRVVREVPDPRLDDAAVQQKADCVWADFISLQRKLRRGELVAAQRWLHVHLVQANLDLLHELRLRRGGVSFHDGRRAEQVLTEAELEHVRCSARLDAQELDTAARRQVAATHRLATELTGRALTWAPPVP